MPTSPVWQRQWLQGEVLQQQLGYWKEKLAGAERLELPTDRPRPAVPRYTSARQPFRIEPEVAQKLRGLGQQEEATLFMTLLAAFQVMLGRYSGQDDVVVGTPIANRTRTELEGLIGFFVNTLVMRTDLSGDPTFRQLLRRVRQTCLEAYAHQDLPFEKLVEELLPSGTSACNRCSRCCSFCRMLRKPPSLTGRGSDAAAVGHPRDRRKLSYFDLDAVVEPRRRRPCPGPSISTLDLFDPARPSGWSRHFQTLLAAVAEHPDEELSAMAMVPEAERQQLLVEWNAGVPAGPERCIHHLVEEQVDRAPDHLAVIFEDQELRYRDLDRRANQVAHRLRALGVGREVPVGLYLDRGLEAVVALLGILKAGGVYRPSTRVCPRSGWPGCWLTLAPRS